MNPEGEPPEGDVPLGMTSWDEAINGMIDDEFNDDFDDDLNGVINDDTGEAENAIADVFGGGPPPHIDHERGPPENILQPADTMDSTPLIILDSLDSGGRQDSNFGDDDDDDDGNPSIDKNDSACLDVVSSESSKGSQGSYAHQVPSLSTSGSAGGPPHLIEEARRSELGSPWTLPGDEASDSSQGCKTPELVNTASNETAESASGAENTSAAVLNTDFLSESVVPDRKSDDSQNEFDLINTTDEEPQPFDEPEPYDESQPFDEVLTPVLPSTTPEEPEVFTETSSSDIPMTLTGQPKPRAEAPKTNEKKLEQDQEDEKKPDQEDEKEPVQNPEEEQGQNPEDEQGQNPEDEQGQNPEDEQGQNPEDEQGQNPEDEQGQNPEDEQGQNPEDEQGQNPEDEQGQNPEDEQDLNPEEELGQELDQANENQKQQAQVPKLKVAPNLTVKTSFSSVAYDEGSENFEGCEEGADSDEHTKEGGSIMSNVSDMVQRFTEVKHDESEDLDDILGAKGKPVAVPTPRTAPGDNALLSPGTDVAGIFSISADRADVSNRSGKPEQRLPVVAEVPEDAEPKRKQADRKLLEASQKAVDALSLGSTKVSPSPVVPEPSLAELQNKKVIQNESAGANLLDNPLDLIVASLEKHGAQQTRVNPMSPITPQPRTQRRDFIGPAQSANNTFDSHGSFQTSASGTPLSTVSKETEDGGSFWSNSRGGSASNVGTSVEGSFSPTGTSVFESTVGSPVDTMGSRLDTLSPGGTSVSASMTHHTMSTAATDTFHTRETYQSQPVLTHSETPMSRRATLSDRTSISRSETDRTETERTYRTETERTFTDRSGLHVASSADTDTSEESRGGRMWALANREVASRPNKPLSPESSRFAESLMARTRSRADPDALINGSGSLDRDFDPPTMVKIGEQDEEKFILNTALARKRVRVVQLLVVGLLALLVSFLGNLWVQSSCHFVSASVEVGERSQVFDLHYGLWKYSPIDSAFQGYSYCTQYDDEYTTDAPILSRWFSGAALAGGTYSLVVLWVYLIFGRGNRCSWNFSVFTAAVSGILEFCTLIILAGPVCQRDECSLGPAGILSVVAGTVYIILAFEMHYNTPMAAWVTEIAACPSNERPGNLMANLEMTDFQQGAQAYVSRIVVGEDEPYKSLNQIQRDNRNPIGEVMLDRDLSKAGAGYRPPALIV